MTTETDNGQTGDTTVITCYSDEKPVSKRTALQVFFSKANRENMCGIMQEPIPDVTPEFVPVNTPLFEFDPSINMAQISECGHSFHALSLVYHFIRNCMSCPICRRGKYTLSAARNAHMQFYTWLFD